MNLTTAHKNGKLPLPIVLIAIASTLAGATYFETRALDKADRPKPPNASCIRCHTDKKTLKAIADKSNDPLYLVHTGELTKEELNQLMSDKPDSKHSKDTPHGAWTDPSGKY